MSVHFILGYVVRRLVIIIIIIIRLIDAALACIIGSCFLKFLLHLN